MPASARSLAKRRRFQETRVQACAICARRWMSAQAFVDQCVTVAQRRQADSGRCGEGQTIRQRAGRPCDGSMRATPRWQWLSWMSIQISRMYTRGPSVAHLCRHVPKSCARSSRGQSAWIHARRRTGLIMRVAFVGLGVMGYPMAGYLAKAGHDVTVYTTHSSESEHWCR